MIAETKATGISAVIVHHPHVIGEEYEEIVTNLDKLAAADLLLQVVRPKYREKPT